MTSSAGMSGISSEPIDPGDEPRSEETPARKAARLWVHQFARALKTCRLYEQNINATVERLLDEVTGTLRRFHEEHGTLALEFTADDVLYNGASTYLARSRDGNLAVPFYRGGAPTLGRCASSRPRSRPGSRSSRAWRRPRCSVSMPSIRPSTRCRSRPRRSR